MDKELEGGDSSVPLRRHSILAVEKMNKKIIAGIIVLVVIIVGAYFAFYFPYQNEVLSENFNKGLQNASATETQIISLTQKFNNQESTDADVLMNTINNEIIPKYSEEINQLNKTYDQANGNETKQRYIELEIKRLNTESRNLNGTVTYFNAIAQYYRGEKSATDAQASINNASTEMTESQKDLEGIYVDIRTLLTQNPDLNQTLQGLHLEKPFYGEMRVQAQTQNVTNSTNVSATTNEST